MDIRFSMKAGSYFYTLNIETLCLPFVGDGREITIVLNENPFITYYKDKQEKYVKG